MTHVERLAVASAGERATLVHWTSCDLCPPMMVLWRGKLLAHPQKDKLAVALESFPKSLAAARTHT